MGLLASFSPEWARNMTKHTKPVHGVKDLGVIGVPFIDMYEEVLKTLPLLRIGTTDTHNQQKRNCDTLRVTR